MSGPEYPPEELPAHDRLADDEDQRRTEGPVMSDSTPDLLPVLDSPPRSGVFVDHDAAPLTADDIALGNALGEVIDVDDDDDNGLDAR